MQTSLATCDAKGGCATPEYMDLAAFVEAEKRIIRAEAGLTDRELEVFEHRARDHSVVQTALDMCISETTVKRDTAKIRAKIARVQHRGRGLSQAQDSARA